jgi:hypothetical protein
VGGVGGLRQARDSDGYTFVHYAVEDGPPDLPPALAAAAAGDAAAGQALVAKAAAELAAWRAEAAPDGGVALVERFRGPARSVGCNVRAGSVTFRRFSTVRAARWCPAGRRGYCEVEVVFAGDAPQWGFCTAEWPRRGSGVRGVGDEAGSWGVDGVRGCAWRAGRRGKLDVRWAAGDVVGLACDPEAGEVRAAVNGVWAGPAGVATRGAKAAGLLPALSCSGSRVRLNMGEAPFRHPPPAGYEPFCAMGPPPPGGGGGSGGGEAAEDGDALSGDGETGDGAG